MKLLVLGASGATGGHLVDRALANGDAVTVLARRPDAFSNVHGQISVIAGNATSMNDIARAAAGQDAVISTLGRGMSLRADGLFSGAVRAVVDGMRQVGVTRLVWLSSFGVGDTYRSASLTQKVMYSTFLRNVYADKTRSERELRTSGLDWTLVYPTTLTDKPALGTYRVGDRLPMRGAPTISRADVADFLHRAAADPTWTHRDAILTD